MHGVLNTPAFSGSYLGFLKNLTTPSDLQISVSRNGYYGNTLCSVKVQFKIVNEFCGILTLQFIPSAAFYEHKNYSLS